MPHTNKPNATKIQDMFNDILSIKDKVSSYTRTCDGEETSMENNISNKGIKAVNGHLISDRSNICPNHENDSEISLPLSSGDVQLNGKNVEAEYHHLTSCDNKQFSNDRISELCNGEELISTKNNAEKGLPSIHNTQSTLHSNSCSDVSSETEDYFDRESISTTSLSCSPFLSKKIVSFTSSTTIGPGHHIAISSGDEGAIVSEASDFENIDSNNEELDSLDKTETNKNDKCYGQHNPQSCTKLIPDSPECKSDISRVIDETTANAFSNPTTATTISSWLSRVQSYGFPADVLRRYINEDIAYEDFDETWWDPKVVRIFDPYYDISPDEIDTVIEGKTNLAGVPVGYCTFQLSNGDEIYGNFRKGVRQVI